MVRGPNHLRRLGLKPCTPRVTVSAATAVAAVWTIVTGRVETVEGASARRGVRDAARRGGWPRRPQGVAVGGGIRVIVSASGGGASAAAMVGPASKLQR